MSTCTRFGIATTCCIAYDDEDTRRDGKSSSLLSGIVEANETDIGGERRKDYDQEADENRKRERGTMKDTVIGCDRTQ